VHFSSATIMAFSTAVDNRTSYQFLQAVTVLILIFAVSEICRSLSQGPRHRLRRTVLSFEVSFSGVMGIMGPWMLGSGGKGTKGGGFFVWCFWEDLERYKWGIFGRHFQRKTIIILTRST